MKNNIPNSISEDIVLVQDNQLKRRQWKIIEGLIVGKDGHVRGVSLRVSSTGKLQFFSRPVQKVYPLEISLVRENDGQGTDKRSDVEEGIGKDSKEGNENGEKVEGKKENAKGKVYKPKRAAASDAE